MNIKTSKHNIYILPLVSFLTVFLGTDNIKSIEKAEHWCNYTFIYFGGQFLSNIPTNLTICMKVIQFVIKTVL